MTDRFDEGKRALEGVSAPDVWAEAERRAGDGAVVPLAPVGGGHGRPRGRWLAVAAAVAVLLVGTVAALAANDDEPVDAGFADSTTGPSGALAVYQADGACPVGITGEPLPEPVGVSPADPFVAGSVGTLVEGSLNGGQTYAVQVPGQLVIDLVGERVEDVQLQRGTAQLWFQGDFTDEPGAAPTVHPVQVRWFTGSQEACESFTVTVQGGTEDENRHAAVDLAERVRLPSELPASGTTSTTIPSTTSTSSIGATTATSEAVTTTTVSTSTWPIDGEWDLYSVAAAGAEPDHPSGLHISFAGTEVAWDDYCRTETGTVHRIDGSTFSVTMAVPYPGFGCTANDASSTIAVVMYSERVHATLEGAAGSIYLTLSNDAGDQLVLRRQNTGPSPSGQEPLG